MATSIVNEYVSLLERKQVITENLQTLPLGYVSKKTIRGNIQCYLQRRESGKIIGQYIKNEDVEHVIAQIDMRKALTKEWESIEIRLKELEKAALLISKDLRCELTMYKLSVGMDSLDIEQKKECSSFGDAMNAIEGVSASEETVSEIVEWQQGNKTFLSLLRNNLKRCRVPAEAKI